MGPFKNGGNRQTATEYVLTRNRHTDESRYPVKLYNWTPFFNGVAKKKEKENQNVTTSQPD